MPTSQPASQHPASKQIDSQFIWAANHRNQVTHLNHPASSSSLPANWFAIQLVCKTPQPVRQPATGGEQSDHPKSMLTEHANRPAGQPASQATGQNARQPAFQPAERQLTGNDICRPTDRHCRGSEASPSTRQPACQALTNTLGTAQHCATTKVQ